MFHFLTKKALTNRRISNRGRASSFELRGEIIFYDETIGRATIKTPSASVVVELGFSDKSSIDILVDSLIDYLQNRTKIHNPHLVLLEGKVFRNGWGKPSKYVAQSIEKLDSFDGLYCVEEFRQLKDNWDGEGTFAPKKESLDWLEKFFINYPKHLKPPAQFMDGDGKTVDMEWDEENSPLVICLDVNLDSHKAEGFTYYSDTPENPKIAWSIRDIQHLSYDFDNSKDVARFFGLISGYGSSNEQKDSIVACLGNK